MDLTKFEECKDYFTFTNFPSLFRDSNELFENFPKTSFGKKKGILLTSPQVEFEYSILFFDEKYATQQPQLTFLLLLYAIFTYFVSHHQHAAQHLMSTYFLAQLGNKYGGIFVQSSSPNPALQGRGEIFLFLFDKKVFLSMLTFFKEVSLLSFSESEFDDGTPLTITVNRGLLIPNGNDTETTTENFKKYVAACLLQMLFDRFLTPQMREREFPPRKEDEISIVFPWWTSELFKSALPFSSSPTYPALEIFGSEGQIFAMVETFLLIKTCILRLFEERGPSGYYDTHLAEDWVLKAEEALGYEIETIDYYDTPVGPGPIAHYQIRIPIWWGKAKGAS
mgnify:CR=1 FL=1